MIANKNKTRIILVISITLIILGILWLNSFRLSLILSGYGTKDISIVYSGVDDNNHDFCVITKANHGEYERIGLFTKNSLGIWKESYSSEENNKGIISFSWLRISGLKTYGSLGRETEWENHLLYCGNNAKNLIPDLNHYFPENTVVSVDQGGNSYRIHIICYGDATEAFKVNIYELLSQLEIININ